MERDTPCSATGVSRLTVSSTASGRPPSAMKFSVTTSTQSTGEGPAPNRAKCLVRSPTPWPRSRRWKAMALPYIFAATTLPPLSLHSFSLLVSTQPLPLQEFWALQALSAPAHDPCPLQELMPAQCTAPSLGFSSARATPATNIEQTAAATAAPLMALRIMVLPVVRVLRWVLHSLRLGEEGELDGPGLGDHLGQRLHPGQPAVGVPGADAVGLAVESGHGGADAGGLLLAVGAGREEERRAADLLQAPAGPPPPADPERDLGRERGGRAGRQPAHGDAGEGGLDAAGGRIGLLVGGPLAEVVALGVVVVDADALERDRAGPRGGAGPVVVGQLAADRRARGVDALAEPGVEDRREGVVAGVRVHHQVLAAGGGGGR